MTLIAAALFGIPLIIHMLLHPLWMRFVRKKMKYKGTKVLSVGGFKIEFGWYKTDEEAKKSMLRKGSDFVERVYPGGEKRIYPGPKDEN